MKKIKYLIIIIVLLIPIIGKADGKDREIKCIYSNRNGNEISLTLSLNEDENKYKINNNKIYDYINDSDENGSEISMILENGRLRDDIVGFSACPIGIRILYDSGPSSVYTQINLISCQDYLDDLDKCYSFKKKLVITPGSNSEIKPGTGYNEVKTCQGQPYEYIEDCGCMPSALTDLTSLLYSLLKIAAPALLLIIGGFELVKAMTAKDENAIKKAQQKLIQKFVAAAAVFLIFTVVEFLVSIIAKDATSIWTCVKYILEGYNP